MGRPRRRIKRLLWFSAVGGGLLLFILFLNRDRFGLNPGYNVGERIDSLHNVVVFYNGGMGNVSGRNYTTDSYNLGLKYQCVEFVKRYYYEHFHHRMPDTYGNAKDFFSPAIADGKLNPQRGLRQFVNGGSSAPQVGDLVVFDGSFSNEYGHVAIVSEVAEGEIEIIQQNVGASSRRWLDLEQVDGKWNIADDRLLGWLRKM
jgi:surface antigen